MQCPAQSPPDAHLDVPSRSLHPSGLQKWDSVLVRHDAVRRPLQPPNDGPYRDIQLPDKDLIIDPGVKSDTIRTNRVNDGELDSPPCSAKPQPVISPTFDSPNKIRSSCALTSQICG
ncbi:unnamed protein product [Schistocephalus solidus]|uniref:Uncharacterized protein n=1 Tax=Schistocephalus solidus TaxID=70667 RepID=A0A183TB12_SCHSO|nr:unnamed protein product [Schistocephalus solidus]